MAVETTITKNSGEIVDLDYLATRAMDALRSDIMTRDFDAHKRASIVKQTVRNPKWLKRMNGCTVSAVCLSVVRAAW